MEQLVKNASKVVCSLATVFTLTVSALPGHSQGLSAGLTFTYDPPKNAKYASPSGFISGGGIDDLLEKSRKVSCFFGQGWIRFKVVDSFKIDSISVEGRIPEFFKELYLKRTRLSEQYWKCSDCNKGGYWITIPVLIGYSASCENEESADALIYYSLHKYYINLFKYWNKPDHLYSLRLGDRSLLIIPIEEISMR